MNWTYDQVTNSIWSENAPDKPVTITPFTKQGVSGTKLRDWLISETATPTEKVRVGSPQVWGRRLALDGNRIMSQGIYQMNPRTWVVWTLPDGVVVDSTMTGWMRYGPFVDGFELEVITEA